MPILWPHQYVIRPKEQLDAETGKWALVVETVERTALS